MKTKKDMSPMTQGRDPKRVEEDQKFFANAMPLMIIALMILVIIMSFLGLW